MPHQSLLWAIPAGAGLALSLAQPLFATNTFPSSGNVGIGTVSPGHYASILEAVNNSGTPRISVGTTNAGGYSGFQFLSGSVYKGGFFRNGQNDDLSLWTASDGSAPRFVISNATGNIGIGTTVPAYKFHATDSSNQVSMGIGEPMSSTTALTGFRAASWNDGNVYLDAKVGAGGSLIYRYGEGAQSGSSNTWMTVKGGNVGIGTPTPSHKLSVNGTIRAKEIIVDTGWADYVFAPDYRLAPLSEVEAHIQEHKRLPGMPSEATVAKEGVSLGEVQTMLLAKLEENTLHLIAQEKAIQSLQRENAELRERLQHVEGRQ